MHYIHLVRWKNLLFIVLIQWLMQRSVIFPILETFSLQPAHNAYYGYLLMCATALIAAGGYVINDYFDVKIDRVNKPEKVIITESITKEAAMRFYQILTGFGIVCGIVLAILTRSFTLGFVFILVPGLLWFYAASYKRQFIWGNVIVSLLAALAVFVVAMLEIALLKKEYADLIYQTEIPKIIYGWTGGFSLFAFLCTWIREVIKDMQDEAGDREMECRTMPIKWGIKKTKFFLYGMIVFTLAALFHFQYHYILFEGTLTVRYLIFGITLPFVALIYLIFRAKTPTDYKQASTLSKFIMLIGIFYTLIFYYLQAKTYNLSFLGLFVIK